MMTSQTYVLLLGTLTFGAPLLIALHELLTLDRKGGKPGWRDPDAPIEPTPLPNGPAAGQRKLPDCLIPKLPARSLDLVD